MDLTGRSLGPYDLQAPLGSGGWGTVCRAVNVMAERPDPFVEDFGA
jgi:hypothetical protein